MGLLLQKYDLYVTGLVWSYGDMNIVCLNENITILCVNLNEASQYFGRGCPGRGRPSPWWSPRPGSGLAGRPPSSPMWAGWVGWWKKFLTVSSSIVSTRASCLTSPALLSTLGKIQCIWYTVKLCKIHHIFGYSTSTLANKSALIFHPIHHHHER